MLFQPKKARCVSGPVQQNMDSLAPQLTADDAAPQSVFRLTGQVGVTLENYLFLDPNKAIQRRISFWADTCAVLLSMGQPAAFRPFIVNGPTKVSSQKSRLSKAAQPVFLANLAPSSLEKTHGSALDVCQAAVARIAGNWAVVPILIF